MENGTRKIIDIKLYSCGYCKNNMQHIFNTYKKEVRKFPALSVLIHHRAFGHILYDTGYSDEIFKNGVISLIYNALNPAIVSMEDSIAFKLKRESVDINSIKAIILSHGHPDHIGGLKFFKSCKLITTREVAQTIRAPQFTDLIFKNMIIGWVNRIKILQKTDNNNFLLEFFPKVYDILGDQSIFGVVLNGHTEGQLGIYIPEKQVLFAADSAWGEDTLCMYYRMRWFPKIIQNNYYDYTNTARNLMKFKKKHPSIRIIFSHDHFSEGSL